MLQHESDEVGLILQRVGVPVQRQDNFRLANIVEHRNSFHQSWHILVEHLKQDDSQTIDVHFLQDGEMLFYLEFPSCIIS